MIKIKNIAFKKFLFGSIVLLLTLPLIQQITSFIELKPLKGSFDESDYLSLSFQNWFDGTYQKNTNNYLKENVDFHSSMVRLSNQIDYSVFNQINNKQIIAGKKDFLFTKEYIRAVYGKDFLGKDVIDDKVLKMAQIRDTLRLLDVEIIVVLAAGKGSYYEELIPSSYSPQQKPSTNHQYYNAGFTKNDINVIDCNSWFLLMKDTSRFPLYPKNGIHWSYYGECLVIDSIINYIEINQHKNLPKFQFDTIEISEKAKHGDDDIEQSMNLLFSLPSLTMAYPIVEIIADSNSFRPNVLTIADSFYWGIYNIGLSKDVFNDSEFWYYYKKVYPQSFKKELMTKDVNVQSKIESQDVIILMATESTLDRFPFGFIDDVHAIYFP